MKAITIRLDDDAIEILEALGGKTKGVRFLVDEHLRRIQGKDREKTPEEQFYDSIYLPADSHLKEVYMAFVVAYIKEGGRRGSLDYYMPSLIGSSGLDEKTIRKNIRKLASSGFVKSDGFLFRPTLRLKETTNKEEFGKILENFTFFIQNMQQYEDWWEKEE